MKRCSGMKVVQYHELFNYFLNRYNINSIDNIEPLPGIKPNSKHTVSLINKIKKNGVKLILQDVYNERRTSEFIAKNSDSKIMVLPHDINSMENIKTFEDFYDKLTQLCN